MIPQLLVVEMLLADASGKLNHGQLELACQMISQAACIMDKVGLPTPQALEVAPLDHLLPTAELAVVEKIRPEVSRVMAAAA